MGGVIESAAFHVHVRGLFQQGHEPSGRAGHPGRGQLLVVEGQTQHLENMSGRG